MIRQSSKTSWPRWFCENRRIRRLWLYSVMLSGSRTLLHVFQLSAECAWWNKRARFTGLRSPVRWSFGNWRQHVIWSQLTHTKTSMKYGTELQKRSVPQWRAHNIDYNEIKDLIKQATLPDAPSDILDRLVSALLQEYESVSASRSLHQTVSPINPHEANSSDEKETSPFAHNSVPQSGCPRLSEKPIHLFVIWYTQISTKPIWQLVEWHSSLTVRRAVSFIL